MYLGPCCIPWPTTLVCIHCFTLCPSTTGSNRQAKSFHNLVAWDFRFTTGCNVSIGSNFCPAASDIFRSYPHPIHCSLAMDPELTEATAQSSLRFQNFRTQNPSSGERPLVYFVSYMYIASNTNLWQCNCNRHESLSYNLAPGNGFWERVRSQF